jgi:hypothetical protein
VPINTGRTVLLRRNKNTGGRMRVGTIKAKRIGSKGTIDGGGRRSFGFSQKQGRTYRHLHLSIPKQTTGQ